MIGGETDSNAAIVGGMIGALVGVKKMPKVAIDKLFSFDCTDEKNKGAWKRPGFLSVKKNGS